MKYTLRIKDNSVFRYVFKKGEYSKGNLVTVHACTTKYAAEESPSNNFFAVCVSKKNGNSVNRNKLKRIAREVYKEEEEKLKKGYNVIIIYKKETTTEKSNFYSIKEDIKKCFEELNLYEENNWFT